MKDGIKLNKLSSNSHAPLPTIQSSHTNPGQPRCGDLVPKLDCKLKPDAQASDQVASVFVLITYKTVRTSKPPMPAVHARTLIMSRVRCHLIMSVCVAPVFFSS